MCFCCCSTRQTINTFLLIITGTIFAYSIITMSDHASNTILYETFEDILDKAKPTSARPSENNDNNNYNNNNMNNPNNVNNYNNETRDSSYTNDITNEHEIRRIDSLDDEALDNYITQNYAKYVSDLKDVHSYYYISTLTYFDLEAKKYNILKDLRSIEDGFSITFMVMHVLFLIIILVFLCYSCGNREYTLSSETAFNVLLNIKTICIILSILLNLLSIIYSILLSVAFAQYIQFIPNAKVDTFIQRISVGISYGVYGFFYFLTLTCGLCAEKNLFIDLGYEGFPGRLAKFYSDGTPYSRNDVPSLSNNVVVYDKHKEDEPPSSKEPINVDELVQIETNRKWKKNKSVLNHNEDNQQVIIISSSKDGKYLYYNGETYMKMNTTISPPTD